MATANELLDRLRESIARLASCGDHMRDYRISPPADAAALQELKNIVPDEVAKELIELYRLCDGIILPDVKNGLFLHTIAQLSRAKQNMLPNIIVGDKAGSIFVIGSDGGGSLFALRLDGSREILYLPTARIDNNTYFGEPNSIEMVAVGIAGFLAWLNLQTEEFRDELEGE